MKSNQLSDQLLRLAKPYTDVSANKNPEKRLNAVLMVACSAWNYAATELDIFKDSIFTTVEDPKAPSQLKIIFDDLVERKHRLFEQQTDVILNFELVSFNRKKIDITVTAVSAEQYLQRTKELEASKQG